MSGPLDQLDQIEQPFLKSSRKRRTAAFLIDHFVLTCLLVALVFLIGGPEMLDADAGNGLEVMSFFIAPLFLLYFFKDSIKGISIGRWIMGIMVRDDADNTVVPSFGRLFLRNLFMIIWPVEFIALAVNDEKKRLGDKMCHTVVLKNPGKPGKFPRIAVLGMVVVLAFSFLLFVATSTLKNSEAYKVAIKHIEASDKIREETGGITGYGSIPGGQVNLVNGRGTAHLEIQVLGRNRDIKVIADLEKEPGGEWELIDMSRQ
jgi:uncharacterized RDD family membrane protein YckC